MDVIKTWVNELPDVSGQYLMEDSAGVAKHVEIKNMAIDNNPARPPNFHVFEDDDYYALSSENGYEEFTWHLLKNR